MSAHVVLILLNELGKSDKIQASSLVQIPTPRVRYLYPKWTLMVDCYNLVFKQFYSTKCKRMMTMRMIMIMIRSNRKISVFQVTSLKTLGTQISF